MKNAQSQTFSLKEGSTAGFNRSKIQPQKITFAQNRD